MGHHGGPQHCPARKVQDDAGFWRDQMPVDPETTKNDDYDFEMHLMDAFVVIRTLSEKMGALRQVLEEENTSAPIRTMAHALIQNQRQATQA